MTAAPYGFNFTSLNNITPVAINISNTTAGLIDQAIAITNTATNGWWGYIVLPVYAIIVFLALADKTALTDFGYDDARALSLGFGLSGNTGLILVEAGFLTNYVCVAMMLFAFALSFIFVLVSENKE